jgi:pimeloyl-ACP methyl ester carboxylesterase
VAAAIRNAKVVELDACGHSMLTEQPNAVLDALAALV